MAIFTPFIPSASSTFTPIHSRRIDSPTLFSNYMSNPEKGNELAGSNTALFLKERTIIDLTSFTTLQALFERLPAPRRLKEDSFESRRSFERIDLLLDESLSLRFIDEPDPLHIELISNLALKHIINICYETTSFSTPLHHQVSLMLTRHNRT